MATITISAGLSWMKTLKARHAELVNLRDANSSDRTHYYGAINREEKVERLYDPKALDRQITLLAREMRILDQKIKEVNATTALEGYVQDDTVLGELQ